MKLRLSEVAEFAGLVRRERDDAGVLRAYIESQDQDSHWLAPRVYWRLKNSSGTGLLSLDVDGSTGVFLMWELLLYPGCLQQDAGLRSGLRRRSGLPKFDLGLWSAEGKRTPSVHDVQGECALKVGKDYIRIELVPEPAAFSVVLDNQLSFEFNDAAELCAITAESVGGEERARLLAGWKFC